MPTTVTVRGEKVRKNLDDDIKNEEVIGIMDKIALQAFRDNPEAEKATVSYNGKQSTYFREDELSNPFIDVDIEGTA